MPRKATIVLALGLVASCTLAIVTAQEAVRPRSSIYGGPSKDVYPREPRQLPAPQQPALLPPPTAVPRGEMRLVAGEETRSAIVRPRRASAVDDRLRGASDSQSDDQITPIGEATAPAFAPAPTLYPPNTAMAADDDASTRSVLKRPSSAVVGEAEVPEIATRPAERMPRAPQQPIMQSMDDDGSLAPVQSSRRIPQVGTTPPPRSIQDLALSTRGPSLRVDVSGPQSITVKESSPYVIHVFNEGDAAAADILLRLNVPASVSIDGAEASHGEAQLVADPQGQARMVWAIPRIEARGDSSLRVMLTATDGQPVDLSVEFTSRPTVAKATIAVRRPQLQLALQAPADMNYGESKQAVLTVSNPGSGDASNVMVTITSTGNRPEQIEVGTLEAGTSRELPIIVAATEPGEMEIKANASGSGALVADTATKVLVRMASLALDIKGPALKYAGTSGDYSVTVVNDGNASADDVMLTVTLPRGVKYLSGIEGAQADAARIQWKVTSIPPGGEKTYQFQAMLVMEGALTLKLEAHGHNGSAQVAQCETKVEAISDLKLVVNDPAGPSPAGEDVVYEVQVMNRGTKAAENVRIVMQFAEGIEPIAVDGGEGKIVPGQVVCEPLAQLPAGEQVTMKIKARADRGGTLQFRVEVTGDDGELRLVSEGASRFFADSAAARRQPAPADQVAPGPAPIVR